MPKNKSITQESKTLTKRKLKYIGEDDWSRPLYKDEESGTIYVEVDGSIHTRTASYGYNEPISPVDFEYTLIDTPKDNPQQHTYMMLNRMQSDVAYFLGNGKGNVKRLHGDSVEEHIQDMKDFWNSLKEKPEWLSWEDILKYKVQMEAILKRKAQIR